MENSKSQKYFSIFSKGLIKENPVLRLVLGTCPTLAITTAAFNGLGMGIAATLVLVGSNCVISLLRNVIPDKVRIPAFITIIAAFVSIVQMLVKAFLPAIDAALGIYLPLIVVNCIILARAEMFASKNKVLPSVLDGLGMGAGFTATLILMGAIRELIGSGTIGAGIFNGGEGVAVPFISAHPMIVLILPPGGFFVFGILVALSNKLAESKGKKPIKELGCAGCKGCDACGSDDTDVCKGRADTDKNDIVDEVIDSQVEEIVESINNGTLTDREKTTDASSDNRKTAEEELVSEDSVAEKYNTETAGQEEMVDKPSGTEDSENTATESTTDDTEICEKDEENNIKEDGANELK